MAWTLKPLLTGGKGNECGWRMGWTLEFRPPYFRLSSSYSVFEMLAYYPCSQLPPHMVLIVTPTSQA